MSRSVRQGRVGGRRLSLGVSAKLLLANLLVFLVFGAVIAVASRSFRRIEALLGTMVVRDVNQNIENAALLKDLSGVFDEANLLASTFLKDEEALAVRGRRLVETTDALRRKSTTAALEAPLGEFSRELASLFDGCAEVNRALRAAERDEQALTASLGALEKMVSDAAVSQILAGEDSVFMEQLNALVSGYRETFLQVNALFLRSTFESARTRRSRSTAELTSLIDDLTLRFRTLTASEARIAVYGPRLVATLKGYRAAVLRFHEAIRVLDERLARVERTKAAVVAVMAEIDEQIGSSTLSARRNISAVMHDAGTYMTLGSAGILVLLVGLTMLFINSNLRRPMAALGSGIEAMRGGDLDTRIELHRSDEWSVVESALNRLAGDLKASYEELHEKNRALEATQGELHRKIEEVVSEGEARRRLEEQLRHAQKMEAIGTLAGGIAHDFNNILSVLIGCASVLRMEMREDDPLRSVVDDIRTSSERAAVLTRDLLAFSRKQVIQLEPIQLNEVVRRVDKLLVRVIGEHIELETRVADEELNVMADGGQLEQVLLNLATNARDAMPEGGRLTMRTERLDVGPGRHPSPHGLEPGAYAAITLADTGVGMDEATRARVFEPFFTTKGVGKGTGLGLSMAYGIVKQHHGDIEVESAPGKGTRFRILLRLVGSASECAPEREPVAALPGGTETILVAEDDPAVRRLMARVLSQFGYAVIEAVDGEDAVRKFVESAERVQLVILDLVMPRKNGRQASEEMRRVRPGVPVLFSSGYAADIVSPEDVAGEGIHFLPKPVAPEVLLTKVRQILA